jgi:hypothetical protein
MLISTSLMFLLSMHFTLLLILYTVCKELHLVLQAQGSVQNALRSALYSSAMQLTLL